MDFFSTIGVLGLGSRLKRLSDHCLDEVKTVYVHSGLNFEPRWFPLFRLLFDQEKITVTAAAEQLGMSHPHVSLLVKELIRAGLVTFKFNPNDGRSRFLVLTVAGKSMAHKMEPIWEAIRQSVCEIVNEEEIHFIRSLSQIENSFRMNSLSKLVQDKIAKRGVNRIRILDYSPKLKRYFESLNREWLEKYFSVEPIDLKYFKYPKRMILDPGGDIFFAEFNGKVVGTCSLLREGKSWELAKMAVTKSAQGKGIGEYLVKEALNRARAAKVKKLMLVTNSKLTPAIRLYEKLGFKEVFRGVHPKYKRGDLVMEIQL